MWIQKEFNLPAKQRGFHLITDELINALSELKQIDCGLLHLFIQHTSASLTINENADPTVRQDLKVTLIYLYQKMRLIIDMITKVMTICRPISRAVF